jgi:hypothetical protein
MEWSKILSSMFIVTDYDKQFSFTIDELGQKCIDHSWPWLYYIIICTQRPANVVRPPIVFFLSYIIDEQLFHHDAKRQKNNIMKYNAYYYHKVASSNTSCLEAHVGFFRLLMKGILDPYVL